MAVLKDYYNENDDSLQALYGIIWKSQTFDASSTYYATSVKLLIYRTGSPGTVTVSFRTMSGGRPTAVDIAGATATFDGNGLTTATAGEWKEIAFSPVELTSGTEYAIVIRATGGNVTNSVSWRLDNSASAYSGEYYSSVNSGATWASGGVNTDAMFEVWGALYPLDKYYSRKLVAIGNSEVWYESSAGTMVELAAVGYSAGDINTLNPLTAVEAFQKLFIVNKTVKKVLDFINTKINTADAGVNPCTYGMTLTGGTSAAKMIVDYVDGITDNVAANIYGKRTTSATFSSGETVTGTNSDGNSVSFVTSAAEVSPPHWYNYTVFGNDTTTYGTMLVQPTLICLYRGRIVTSGDSQYPHAWQMTKIGVPWKVLYDYSGDGDLSAVTYANNFVGVIGDMPTALIPYKDDLLIFGCTHSLWILIGDPLGSGQLAEVTSNTGVWGPRAWCIDNTNNLYFLGDDGIYKMPIGETSNPPVNISKIKLPNLISDLDLDASLHRVVLSFDPKENGVIISKTLLDGGTNTNYFFSLLTDGFFPETYPASCGVFSSYYYPATDETYKKFLIGCNDGYIREFDSATKNDTTTSSTAAISSYCTIIQQLGENENRKSMLNEFRSIMAGGASGGDFSDSDGVSWELHKGEDAETVLEDIKDGATAFATGTWSTTGKQNKSRPRLKAGWAGIKLYNSTASETWAIERLYGEVLPKGKA